MKDIHTKHTLSFLLLLFAVIFSAQVPGPEGLTPITPLAHAANPEAETLFHGWAWMANYGWLSWNSDYPAGEGTPSPFPYSVGIDYDSGSAVGKPLSGHAWSESLGWLSFNRNETGTPPAGAGFPADPGSGSGAIAIATSTPTGEYVRGWARFLNACAKVAGAPSCGVSGTNLDPNGGGWDGWVSFNAASSNNALFAANTLTGYAWGGEDGAQVGWISLGGTAADGTPYSVTRDAPPSGIPATTLTPVAGQQLTIRFVANRKETTRTTVDLDAASFVNPVNFSVATCATAEETSCGTTSQLSSTVGSKTYTSTVTDRSTSVTSTRTRLRLELDGLLPTGIYNIRVKAVDSLVPASSSTSMVKLRVINVVPGFGEN